MATKAKKQPAVIDEAAKRKREQSKARTNLSSAINAAAVIEAYSKTIFGEQQGDPQYVYEELIKSIERVWDGDLKKCEAMLLSQAVALQSIFTNLTRRAIGQEYMNNLDTFLRLGLKAQAQAVRTIEALAEMKNPRSVAFVKQANIANNQQVNNHPSQAGENQKSAEQTINGEGYELLPDTRASSIEGAVNPPVEALAAIDRAKDSGRQREGISERI